MHGVNLDLLGTTPFHADGRPKDPHAHHQAEVTALARAARRDLWRARFARLRSILFRHTAQPAPRPCTEQT